MVHSVPHSPFRISHLLLLAGILVAGFAVPGDLKLKLDALGFAVCHQIHNHSFDLAGHQLPLCARCTGIYLGAISALLVASVLRPRSIGLPSRGMLALLGVFFGAMVLDGINSTLQSFGANLWDSTNLLRLLTGTLAGVAVALVMYPVLNMTLWRREVYRRESVLDRPACLLGYLAAAGVLAVLVLTGVGWLLYPLSILSVAGMLALLTIANTMLVLMATRREASLSTAFDAVTPILLGLILSLLLLALIVWGRSSLAPFMAGNPQGLPLLPGLP
jgi:uncharacterized membrane protein